jgi:hypothetical protein
MERGSSVLSGASFDQNDRIAAGGSSVIPVAFIGEIGQTRAHQP